MPRYYEEEDPNGSPPPPTNPFARENVESSIPIQASVNPVPLINPNHSAQISAERIAPPLELHDATCVNLDENVATLETKKILEAERRIFAEAERQKLEQQDADLAFALQQQIQYEEEYQSSSQYNENNTSNGATRIAIPSNGISPTINDDEQFARTLNYLEQERANERVIQQQQYATQQRKPFLRRVFNFIFPTIFIAVAIYMALYWFTPYLKGRNPFDIFGKGVDWGDVWEEGDPTLWRINGNKRGGLELIVLNACTEDWDTYLETAISDWNESPSLDLTLEKVDVDRRCVTIRGKLKVCNDDYGATSWVGVNEVILENGFIIASTARMNENFLARASDAKKQYTMCHELGHGLGLPHTDENFFNADLGNCLDYTNSPQNNMHPDQMNFNTLLGMYGSVSGKVPETDIEKTTEISTTTDLWGEQDFKKWKHAKNGLSLVLINALTSDWFPIFDTVYEDWNQAPALDLVAVSTAADPDCEPVFQSMKMCNGDYGNTPWVGINELILENDKIIMSTARMNDHYLKFESQAKRRYTLCHEVGHGFGLPHTDEDHLNENTGNCLDYTDDPEENFVSGDFNWQRLEQMYGVFGVAEEKDDGKNKKEKNKNKNDRRFLRPWDHENSFIASYPFVETDKWELVKQSDFGEIHIAKLGEGMQVVAQVFYA